MRDPKAIRKAIMTAKSIASLVDPKFSRIPLPDLGVSAPEVYVPEHSPAMHEAFGLPMPKGYAAGGDVEGENSYAQPNEFGLYSHAAATAAELPQERGTPEQFRGMLLNKGVKPAELEWSGFDEAFADQPQVTRQQIAEHFHANRPPVQEKRFQELPSVNELNALRRKHLDEVRDYQAKVRETPDFDPGGERWKRLQYWHQAEKRELLSKYDRPHHETYTIPGGENYREILLKHGGEEGFKGVPVHFKGEPNVLTSLMVKDREDAEGDKVLHLDELQSDWAQKGRQTGFDEPQDQREIYTIRYPDGSTEYGVRGLAEARRAAEEGGGEYELSMTKPAKGIDRAPYVTKTEDWVDLGLKKALQEAAEGGHDKLAWSPGKIIADRYDLAKHVGAIQHEKNDDGTHNIVVYAKNGETLLDRDDMEPQEIADYLGKGIAERIVNGEGETGQKEYERHRDAMEDYDNFLLQAADQYAKAEMQGADIPEDRREHMHGVLKKVALNGLQPYSRNRGEILDQLGLRDREYELRSALEDARYDLDLAPEYSPYRDWRHLKTDDLQIGEKWPFEMYDRMIPKRLLKLAKQHDPEAKLEKSVISHKADHDMYEFYPEDEYGNASDEPANPHPMTQTELHAIRITPKMRESILKKGFPAYAQGGEVEAYAEGGAPDDQYTQNPNGGLMFPPEEGAARLETMQRRNALVSSGKKPDAGLPKNPRIVIPAPEGSKLPDFVTGNITFDDWRKRHEKILSDDEIHHSSNWYKNIYGNFLKYYPDPQEAKKMMRAWLVAQQNVSPAGAMNNVLMQQEQMERGDPEHLWRAGGMPNPTAAARAVLSGQPISGGVGQKISDFVDSAEGKSTRSWMGDHPHGGDPFVVDVHTARDTGMIDQELINHLKRVGYNPEQLDKLQIDLKGTPTEAAYENRAQFGRDLTAYLNKMNWKGRNDWTPAEVQAVGWMGMTKLTRNAEEDSESGLGRNLRRISYELSPGEGSPWSDKYGEAFENLPDEDRYAITQKMADSAMEHAKKLSGINVHSLVHGTGAWENYQNPAAVAQSLSTQRAADIAAAALGHMLQQTEVWHNRIKPIGASPKGFALDFIERGSKNLADPGALREFWQKVMNADPHGIVKGYQPITLPSGEVGLRALFDKGGAKAQKAIEDLFAPHKVDKEGNIVQKNPFRTMLEDHPFDLDIMGHEAEITKHRNDWKEQKNGEGYLSRLVDLLGYDPSATLNSARKQLEKEFEQHLDEAHKRKGTTWRKAYGGALKAAPVVGAAMKYLLNSHHDPSSKMRFARSAMMIAKSTKKK